MFDMRIEVVPIPVSDVDRAKSFYVDQVGFNCDFDHRVSESQRMIGSPRRFCLFNRDWYRVGR